MRNRTMRFGGKGAMARLGAAIALVAGSQLALAAPGQAANDAYLTIGVQLLTAQPVPPGTPIVFSLLYACSSLTEPSCNNVHIDIPLPAGQPGNIPLTISGPFTDPTGLHYANPAYRSGTSSAFDFTITTPANTPDGTTVTLVATGTATNSNTQTATATATVGATPPGRYNPLTPARIADSRNGTGGMPALRADYGTIGLRVTGVGGVPSTGVGAVAMNVTITEPTAAGYLTVFPSGNALPLAANLNFVAGQTVPNLVVVKAGGGGVVGFRLSAGTAHVVVDVAGWYSDVGSGNDGRFMPVAPARLLDTRDGTGGGVRLGAGASLDLQVAGRGGVPAGGPEAAVLNVAATGPTAGSFLTVYPTGEPRPLAANLNFQAGNTVSNRAMVKLGSGGRVTVYNNLGSTDVVVDVSGWYTDASVAGALGTFVPLQPVRLLDTRDGTGGLAGPRAPGSTAEVQVTGRGGVPASGVRAVILNATVTQPAGGGYLTVFPAGTARPFTSDLNYAAGETRPNLVVVQVGAGGRVALSTSTTSHVVFDIAGWMS